MSRRVIRNCSTTLPSISSNPDGTSNGCFAKSSLSATYRQSSIRSQMQQMKIDPENRLLARGPRRRLPAEFVRDHALSISGLLKEKLGGPGVHPYQPA